MARFFIPNLRYKPRAGDDISSDVLYALEKNLPKEAVVCVGFTAGHREVDLAIFTSVAVHVVESKDKRGFPVRFFKNQGLCVQNESGTWDPIINDRGLGEYVNVQASKNAGAVSWDCKENGCPMKTYGYILVPHPQAGSDVSENGDVVRISLGVADLLESIQQRESVIQNKGRGNGYTEADFVAIAQRVFNLHETEVINGYKIGDPVPVFEASRGREPMNGAAYAAGKTFGNVFRRVKLPDSLSTGQNILALLFTILSNILLLVGVAGFFLTTLGSFFFRNSLHYLQLTFFAMLILGFFVRGVLWLIVVPFLFNKKYAKSASPVSPESLNAQQSSPVPEVGQATPSGGSNFVRSVQSLPRRATIPAGIATAVIVLLLIVSLFSTQRVCVSGGSLNIRQTPSTSGALAGKLDTGDCVRVNGKTQDGQWLRISGFPHGGDWIAAGYVTGQNMENLKIAD
ncbi:MAG: SH3 domain-containing protein [Anaerolineaceae bacterium]